MSKMSAPTYTDSLDATDLKAESFRVFLDRHRGGIRQGDHGNPNPLLRILPALYAGNFTVGQALAILFSGSPSNLTKGAIAEASETYLDPTSKALEAISSVIGLPVDAVQDQIFQHNVIADPDRALNDENPYAINQEDLVTPEEGDTFTFDQLVDRYNDAPAAQEYGLSVTYDPETNTFVEDVSGFGFEGDAATNTYTPEEFMERLGVEGSFEETQVETEVARPEGTVNLAELSKEQVGTFWPEIQQSLESLGGAVKQAVFGPGGVPKTPDELLEAIEEGVMEGLKGPIAVTFDPEVGVTLDLKIPVGFEINGTSLQLPVFNEDGQFVLGQSIETAINQAGELITATGDKIGDIFTDGQGNIVLDVIDAGQVVLEGLGVTESGNIIGTLAENAIGDFIFNQNTGQPELTEEVDITTDDTTDDDTTVDRGNDVVNRDDPEVIPLTGPDDPEELTEEPIKPPKGSQYIDDKAGNIVGAIGPDGTVYNVDENGEWSISTSDVVTEGGTTVLPGETEIKETPKEPPPAVVTPVVVPPDETPKEPPLVGPPEPPPEPPPETSPPEQTEEGGTMETGGGQPPLSCPSPDMPIKTGEKEGEVKRAGDLQVGDLVWTAHEHTNKLGFYKVTYVNIKEEKRLKVSFNDGFSFVGSYTHKFKKENSWVESKDLNVGEELQGVKVVSVEEAPYGEIVVITVEDAHTYFVGSLLSHNKTPPVVVPPPPPSPPPVVPPDETPEEPPLVGPAGPTGPTGATGATGAAGAAGAPARSRGYMGGLSYQLPQFVGVQYQPKDYTVELDRIINESLFKGMI